MGQIYVPAVNWFLLVAVIGLVLGFRSSSALASAYGIAVTGTFATNTLLAFVLFRVVWRKPLWMTIAGAAVFLTIELTFFAANLTKIVSGGWLPLVVGADAFTGAHDLATRPRDPCQGDARRSRPAATLSQPADRRPTGAGRRDAVCS